jgi:hypothetical protein
VFDRTAGFSVSRSLREAPAVADAAVAALAAGGDVRATAAAVWQQLWPQEKRRQVGGGLRGLSRQMGVGVQRDQYSTDMADRRAAVGIHCMDDHLGLFLAVLWLMNAEDACLLQSAHPKHL